MSQTAVAAFLQTVKQDPTLKVKLRAAVDMGSCLKVAQASGYDFTPEELEFELSHYSQEELAEMINPGIAPRRHLNPE